MICFSMVWPSSLKVSSISPPRSTRSLASQLEKIRYWGKSCLWGSGAMVKGTVTVCQYMWKPISPKVSSLVRVGTIVVTCLWFGFLVGASRTYLAVLSAAMGISPVRFISLRFLFIFGGEIEVLENDWLLGVVYLLEIKRAMVHAGRDEDAGSFGDGELLRVFSVFAQGHFDHPSQVWHFGAVSPGEKQELVEIMIMMLGYHLERLG